jgi:hypothetical protein
MKTGAVMQISPRIPVSTNPVTSTHQRGINGTRYQFVRYDDGDIRVVSATRWYPAASSWGHAHAFVTYLRPTPAAAVEEEPTPAPSPTARAAAARHGKCERRDCEDCGDDFDECEAKHRDEFDAVLCEDCVDGRRTAAEDEANYRAYAYC